MRFSLLISRCAPAILAAIAFLVSFVIFASAEPLSFLGDVSNMSPLDCLDRQCSAVGGNCAQKCVGVPDQIVCMVDCKRLLDECYKSRCFLTIRKVIAARAYCCDSGRFGCLFDDSAGCLDSLRKDCSVHKGFNASFDFCVNANLSSEQGESLRNFTPRSSSLRFEGVCRDTSQCDVGRVCFNGSCVMVSQVTPADRAEVDCLDDADCPSSTSGRYVCLESVCLMRPGGFCRVDSDCRSDWLCSNLTCLPPPPSQVIKAPVPVEPARAVLQPWAKSREGIMARVAGVAGSPKSGDLPSGISIGRFFSWGDDVVVPDGVGVEFSLADGSRAMVGPGSSLFMSSINAAGSSILIQINLRKGAVIFDVAPLQEVDRKFEVSVRNRSVLLSTGIVHVVAYNEGALRISSVQGNVTFDGVFVESGYSVLMDASGDVRPASKLSQQDLDLLEQAAVSLTVSPTPAYSSESIIEKYGLLALAILAVFILSMWVFFKRPKRNVF